MRLIVFLTALAAVFFGSLVLTFGQTVPAAPNAFEAERQEILKDTKRTLQFIGDDTERILDMVDDMPDYLHGIRSDMEDWHNGWMNSQMLLLQYYGIIDADGNVIEGGSGGLGLGGISQEQFMLSVQMISALIYVISFLTGCLVVRIFTGALRF